MTVKELRDMLEQYDNDLIVYVNDYEYGPYKITIVKKEKYEELGQCIFVE